MPIFYAVNKTQHDDLYADSNSTKPRDEKIS
jgi:hypothetical protein